MLLGRRDTVAFDYNSWQKHAIAEDIDAGIEPWKYKNSTQLYDYQEIENRHEALRHALEAENPREVLYCLNEGVHGNIGGLGNNKLYQVCKSGTKKLIDEYIGSICDALEYVHCAPPSEISNVEKSDFFRRASHCFGRSALLLSGGGGLIYFHHGVVQELISHNLMPSVISGASAGSVVAAQIGTQDLSELKAGYFTNKKYQAMKEVSLLDLMLGKTPRIPMKTLGEQLLDEIVEHDLTFQEAYEKTGVCINIAVSPAEKHQTSRLLNAITSPNVYVRSAVSASISLPGAIPAERLFAKGFDSKPRPYLKNRRWIDGSFSDDLPVRRLSRIYGVNHFVVSLINPLVVPFLTHKDLNKLVSLQTGLYRFLISYLKDAVIQFDTVLPRDSEIAYKIAFHVNSLFQILNQRYTGDINIVLPKSKLNIRDALCEWKDGGIEQLLMEGRKAAWPKLSQIENCTKISKCIDGILQDMNNEGIHSLDSKMHLYF
ncbi:MAG: DUF3336 domain-containing protein [Pseudomonadales bacterium]|nr:DUF3336 domain-containing protein [Pseudomonadales bacterium]